MKVKFHVPALVSIIAVSPEVEYSHSCRSFCFGAREITITIITTTAGDKHQQTNTTNSCINAGGKTACDSLIIKLSQSCY